jgi:L-alanine-DL-glutamate epimerase-like enolase superfamily enzyme
LGWTYAPVPAAALVEGLLAPAVQGIDVLDVPAAAAAMARTVRNPGRTGLASYAVSAVDCALWDLKARLLEVPLHKLLGAVRDSVAVYGSGGFTTYTEGQLREQLQGWAQEQHIPRVKIKIGQDGGTHVARDLDRIRQARAAVGPGTELFVDANGGYTVKQAVRVLREVADEDVTWFEEPVSSDDLAGLRTVRAAVAAATPNFRHLEWFHDHVRIENLFFDGTLDPDGGWVRPGKSPGNGLSFRSTDAGHYRVR